MSGTRRLIRLLCIATPLPVVALGAILLSGTPSPLMMGIALAATALSLVLAVVINNVVTGRLLYPIRSLDNQLSHDGNIESASLPALAHHIRDRISRERATGSAELEILRERLLALEQTSHLNNTVNKTRGDLPAQLTAGVIDTSTELIKALRQPLPNNRAPYLAERLELLADELGASCYANDFSVQTDVRQIVDAAIDAADDCEFGAVTPMYSEAVCGRIDANPSLLAALVFHMLADLAPVTGYLHVRQHSPGRLAVFATSWRELTPSVRFTELLEAASAQFEAGLLTVPVTGIDRESAASSGLAWVVARTEGENRALSARLAGMGYSRAETPETADVALVTHADDPAVIDLPGRCPRIVVAGVPLHLAASNVTRIGYPLIHRELGEAIDSQRQRLRLLAVDDDPRALELLTEVCLAADVDVTTASTANAALELASSAHFDAALIDLNLGLSDGIALAESMQTSVKPFLLTAFADDGDRRRAAAAGIEAIFEKPFQPDVLRSQLAGHKIAATPASEPTDARFDPELALRLAHFRPDVAREMIEALIQSIPADVDRIRLALNANDSAQVRELAHRFNGGLQYCGVPRLRQATQTLETAARHEGPDEIRLAYLVFEHEAHAIAREYDPDANIFDTSVVKGQRT